MATTLIIKNSSVAGKVPDPSVLQAGELGVNLKDQKLYSKDVDGNVFELGRGSTASGGSGDKPDSPAIGDLYYDTDLEVLLVWNGSEWETVGSVTSVNGKTGEVILTADDVGALAPGDDVSKLNNDAGYLTSADLPDETVWLREELSGTVSLKVDTDVVKVFCGGDDKPGFHSLAKTSIDWTNPTGGVAYKSSNYAINTFTMDTMGNGYIRKELVIGKPGLDADAIEGQLTVNGTVTASVFDLESLPSLP